MSSYTSDGSVSPHVFALGVGLLVTAVAALELIASRSAGAVTFSPLLNLVHWVVGVGGVTAYARGAQWCRRYAEIVGSVFLLLALAGFVPALETAVIEPIFGAPVSLMHNVLHFVIGVAGLMAAFSARWQR